jgi:hypothetical protein
MLSLPFFRDEQGQAFELFVPEAENKKPEARVHGYNAL